MVQRVSTDQDNFEYIDRPARTTCKRYPENRYSERLPRTRYPIPQQAVESLNDQDTSMQQVLTSFFHFDSPSTDTRHLLWIPWRSSKIPIPRSKRSRVRVFCICVRVKCFRWIYRRERESTYLFHRKTTILWFIWILYSLSLSLKISNSQDLVENFETSNRREML